MPLFSNKFSPKKVPPRKVSLSEIHRDRDPTVVREELGLETGVIRIKLGQQETIFDKHTGQWIPELGSVSGTHKENVKLKKNVQHLEEENHLLKLKVEILLDMLTQTTAESHLQEKEIQQLRDIMVRGVRKEKKK